MSDNIRMTMEVWNHGTHDNVDKPCGEVDVFRITGDNLPIDLLDQIIFQKDPLNRVDLFEDFGDLPTERAIKVVVDWCFECGGDGMAGGWYANILSQQAVEE